MAAVNSKAVVNPTEAFKVANEAYNGIYVLQQRLRDALKLETKQLMQDFTRAGHGEPSAKVLRAVQKDIIDCVNRELGPDDVLLRTVRHLELQRQGHHLWQ